MIQLIEFLQTHIKIVVWGCYGLLAAIVGFALVVDTHHAHSWVEQHIPAFWSVFGLGAAAVIIGVSRWFGKAGIQVRTDFYDNPSAVSEEEK
ncbi:MAG: hypothetical protein CSB34_05470 [Desulfobulbus propionicus]|nr:MAG: hypothetical protein CSB34_05470 [Desulfobulbus propionicus]PIE63651.1 MAG: hypothetical protein CSA26_11885 [Desulfobacterales bacterium]